ncbi:heparin cofactor 2 [Takifugu rubripes]|uniref:Serpin peptidase inhibitor, clade D (heparin cofactor), member 1 n=1 Tax=Takifugu rubripes TaxID=31033 RepID=H2U856_TAKRU|nr:heparin cofactor 2 [Takifugu rubripes]XP_029685579.1 heparin cofactor 2 [Takifugu rubripes]
MWVISLVCVACLMVSPSLAGNIDLSSAFSDPKPDPRGFEGAAVDIEAIPLEFHKENTVTTEILFDGFEDEDYIDFDKILSSDEYFEGDNIDDIATPAPDIDIFAEPSDPKIRRARLLRLFQGQSRLQRLNIINARFGFNLYRSLRNTVNQSDNILLAPAGISIAIGMMSLGTGAGTHDQIYKAMGFSEFVNASHHYDNTTVHKLFRKLTHRLFRRNFGYKLRAVNDVYVKKDVAVKDVFRAETKAYYFAEPQSVNFRDPGFLDKANSRILKLTKGLIRQPLKSIDPNMVLMLLNYLYFKGTWEQKFPKENTHYRNFRVNEKTSVRVPMMINKGNYLAAADHELECDILQLPYTGNISMLIALPRKITGMRTLEQEISPTVVSKWFKNMTNRTREVVIPRFKLEQSYDLIENLQELGLTDMFKDSGDFSEMTSEKVSMNWLKHQGTITVNEEGTEAAALTQVGFMPLSSQIRFTVDHPFLFLIYEHRTDCLVFIGRVSNPSQS